MTRAGTACGPHIFILENVPVDKVNIDELVNYKEEYTKFVQKPEFKRDRMVSLCPFHDDRKPSFSVDLKTGKFVCFACAYCVFCLRQGGQLRQLPG